MGTNYYALKSGRVVSMTIIKCDRCGKELDNPCDFTVVGLSAGEYFGAVKPERYDLCNYCAETLKIWLHSEEE